MYQNFDDEKKEKASRNPFNRHILKGGQVDPGSKMYQRSVAGREKLDTMLQRLWSDGMDEADVFMAGVKALTSRDKGYVGAYLDSKNPGRIYQKNEAMAITDQVMKDAGIGSHPGNRLTREKDEEGKAKRKEENISRGGYGPKQAPGAKAMSVRQQRKQGKRPSTGQPVEETDREGIADRETGPRSEWQNTLKDALEGKITAADVVKAFSKEKQSPLSQSPQAQAKRDQKTRERQQKMRDQIAEQKGLEDQEAAAGPEPDTEGPTREIKGRIKEDLGREFKSQYDTFRKGLIDAERKKSKGIWDTNKEKYIQPDESELRDLIDRSIEYIREKYGKIDAKSAKSQLRDYLVDNLGIDPYDGEEEAPAPSTAPTETAAAAPEPAEGATPEEKEEAPAPAPGPAAAPSGGGEKPAAPETEPAEGAAPEPEAPKPAGQPGKISKPGQFKGQVSSDINTDELTVDDTMNLLSYKSAMRRLRSGRGMTGGDSEGYNWGVSRGLPPTPEEEDKLLESRKQPEAPAAGPEAPKPAQRKRTRAETQEIQRRGSEELAKTQETNRKLEAMTKRMANSPLVKDEEMRNWINNDLERLLKSFTPAEKTEDPWEQDGPEATGIPEPTAQAPASQKALAGQPGPKGLLPPGPNRATRRAQRTGTKKRTTKGGPGGEGFGGARAAAPEIMKAGKEAQSLEDFKTYLYNKQGNLLGGRGFETGGSDQGPDPYAKYRGEPIEPSPGAQEGGREPATAGRGQEGQGSLMKSGTEFTKKPEARGDFKKGQKPKRPASAPRKGTTATETAPPKRGRRTKAEGDEIRRRGQEALEQIQGEARKGREVQDRMANSRAATGEAPRTGREADITRRGEEALRGEVYGNIKDRPGMTNREANRILRRGGYTQPRPGLDSAARAVTEGMDRHDAARKNLPKRVKKAVPKFNSSEYQEFAQSIRSMMR